MLMYGKNLARSERGHVDSGLGISPAFGTFGLLDISNSVLHHWPSNPDTDADATLNLTHGMFIQMLTGKAGLKDMLLSDELDLEGSKLDLVKFFSLFDKPQGRFDIVTP